MRIMILQTGGVPAPLGDRFGAYPDMFGRMFAEAGFGFTYAVAPVHAGAPMPALAGHDAVIITGSAAGVYDDYPWLDPLRAFIRDAYAARTPMLGVCFGHQIMADALGGDVRKSEKGWGLGRHVYGLLGEPAFADNAATEIAIGCSHQDQVIAPPGEAETFLASDFTPHAGLVYRNGAAISVQPHPEFTPAYTRALAELRRGKAPDAIIDTAIASTDLPVENVRMAGWIGRFLQQAASE